MRHYDRWRWFDQFLALSLAAAAGYNIAIRAWGWALWFVGSSVIGLIIEIWVERTREPAEEI